MKDWESVQLAIKRWLLLGCVAGVLLTSLLMMISGPIARLIFQKIVSSAGDIQMLNVVQLLSLLQLPFVMSAVVVARAVIALQLNRKLVSLSVLALTTNAVFDIALIRLFGISGIVISTVLVQAVILLVLFRIVRGFLIARIRPVLQFDSKALEGID